MKSYKDQVLGSSYLSDQYKTYVTDLKTCLTTQPTDGEQRNDQSCEHHRKNVYPDVCLLLDHPNFSDSLKKEYAMFPYVKTIYAASTRIGIIHFGGYSVSTSHVN